MQDGLKITLACVSVCLSACLLNIVCLCESLSVRLSIFVSVFLFVCQLSAVPLVSTCLNGVCLCDCCLSLFVSLFYVHGMIVAFAYFRAILPYTRR